MRSLLPWHLAPARSLVFRQAKDRDLTDAMCRRVPSDEAVR